MRTLLALCLCLAACDDAGADAAAADARVATDAAPDAGLADAAFADAGLADAGPPADAAVADAAPLPPLGGPDRPALVFVPAGEPPAAGWPLLFLLHGFRASPELMHRQFPFGEHVDDHGWIVVLPHGARDESGFPYWQAHERVDDVGEDVPYLLDLADQVAARYPTDLDHFYVAGHSNGGAMAQSLACYAADRIRGFINISGVNITPERCAPSRPVTALHISGTLDDSVRYEGSATNPGVDASATWWAETVLGCVEATDAEPADLTLQAPDAETAIRRWSGCAPGTHAERWRMDGVRHAIIVQPAFLDAAHAALVAP